MKIRLRLLLGLSAMCLAMRTTYADIPSTISLEDVRTYALAHSPKAVDIHADIARKAAESLSIGKLQNPRMQGSTAIPVDSENGNPKTQFSISISQNLRASDFGDRSHLSSLIESLSTREQEIKLQKFLGDVSIAYYQAWALQREKKHLQELLSRAKKILSLLSAPSSIGQFNEPQRQTARALVATLEADLLGLQHSNTKATATLIRLSNYPFKDSSFKMPTALELPPYPTLVKTLHSGQNSLLKRHELMNQLATQRLTVAKRDRYTDFQPQVGYMKNEEGDNFIGIGVSFDLPFFQGNESTIAQKRAEQSKTQASLSYLRSDRFEEEFRLMYDGTHARIAQAKAYEKKVLPALKEALRGSEELFRNGQLSLFELWKAETDYHDALDRSTRLHIEAFSAALEISLLTGTVLY